MADWRLLAPPMLPHPHPTLPFLGQSLPPPKKKTGNPREDFESGYSFFNSFNKGIFGLFLHCLLGSPPKALGRITNTHTKLSGLRSLFS